MSASSSKQANAEKRPSLDNNTDDDAALAGIDVMTDADFERALDALREEGDSEVGDLLKLMNENRIISWEEAERIMGDSSNEPVKSSLPQQTRPTEPDNDTDVAMSIKRLLDNDPKLKEINLNNMKRTPIPQVKRMIAALAENTHLEKLSLANMGLYDMDVQPLVEVLETNDTLRCVNLETNYLSGDFFSRLFRAALTQQALEEVKAVNQGVAFSTTSEREIIEAVFENRGLTKVSINLRLPEGRHKVEQAMIRNQEIRRILRRRELLEAKQLAEKAVEKPKAEPAAKSEPVAKQPKAAPAKKPSTIKMPPVEEKPQPPVGARSPVKTPTSSRQSSMGMAVFSAKPATQRSSVVALGSMDTGDEPIYKPKSPTKPKTSITGGITFPGSIASNSIAERRKKFAEAAAKTGGSIDQPPPLSPVKKKPSTAAAAVATAVPEESGDAGKKAKEAVPKKKLVKKKATAAAGEAKQAASSDSVTSASSPETAKKPKPKTPTAQSTPAVSKKSPSVATKPSSSEESGTSKSATTAPSRASETAPTAAKTPKKPLSLAGDSVAARMKKFA